MIFTVLLNSSIPALLDLKSTIILLYIILGLSAASQSILPETSPLCSDWLPLTCQVWFMDFAADSKTSFCVDL